MAQAKKLKSRDRLCEKQWANYLAQVQESQRSELVTPSRRMDELESCKRLVRMQREAVEIGQRRIDEAKRVIAAYNKSRGIK